ncbi:MAG: dihydrodipicolinate synthase family protein [Terrimicrobiaceae bacterium]|jgi:4-hydroxy-tetrahydrodipicolinate synthase
MSSKTIRGIFTPNVVPFHDDHRVNEGELRRYVSWLIDKGVTGLYPNGSTGEFIRLSFEQRIRVVEIIADEVRGRVPILAGAAEPNVPMVLEACKRYADLGCRAVSVTGPYYFKVSQPSIEHYFRDLAAKSPIDIILYNIPQFSNEISLEVVKRLAADCPRIVGIKDSSRDMPRFMDTLNEVKTQRPDFSCLIGCEEILLPILLMGGDGGTIATSGVAPEAVMKLYQSFLQGDLGEAKRVQFKLLELIKTMFAAGNFPEGFREGVNLRGFQTGRGPQAMSPEEIPHFEAVRSKLDCLLKECGFPEGVAPAAAPKPSVSAMLERINQRIP